jgi:hypothetical protein
MFWATVGLVGISVVATIVNYLAVRASADPHVIVYASADMSRSTFIQLIIENTGKRVAKNVRFSLSEPIPNRTAGGHGQNAVGAGNMDAGPLFSGIPALGPGAKRMMLWGSFLTLHSILGDRTVTVKAEFESDPLLGFGPMTDHEVVSILEIQSFWDTDAVDPDGARRSAKQLERIADLLEKREDREGS